MNFPGAFRLFRLFGIDVFLHWSWLLIAFIEIKLKSRYDSVGWNAIEYVTLFAIVLTHEFGHALACRSVGGKAEQIILWPLGGVAYVSPPMRPRPVLWSIAAGPLVNVVLLPITWGLAIACGAALGDFDQPSNLTQYLFSVALINTGLLIFNMLPIYPLDGGQIFQSLLWFVVGYRRSLQVASIIGIIASVIIGIIFVALRQWWFVVLAFYMGSRALRGFQIARQLAIQEEMDAKDAEAGRAPPSVTP